MTEDITPAPAALPPMGFYPDPEVPGQVRFWDGTRWHASQPTYTRPRLGGAFQPLAIATACLIALQAVSAVAGVGLYGWGLAVVTEELEAGRTTHADLFDTADVARAFAVLGLLSPTIVVWCMWQYRVARSADRDKLRRGPGMHVGSWFIPVAMLWLPIQNMRDLWAAHFPRQSRALLGWWWTMWIVVGLTGNGSSNLADDVIDPESFKTYVIACLVDSIVWMVLCVLALVIVYRLTRSALEAESAREAEGAQPR